MEHSILTPTQGINHTEANASPEKEKKWNNRMGPKGMRSTGSAFWAGLPGQTNPMKLDYFTALFARKL